MLVFEVLSELLRWDCGATPDGAVSEWHGTQYMTFLPVASSPAGVVRPTTPTPTNPPLPPSSTTSP
jgi:hypothetical protein